MLAGRPGGQVLPVIVEDLSEDAWVPVEEVLVEDGVVVGQRLRQAGQTGGRDFLQGLQIQFIFIRRTDGQLRTSKVAAAASRPAKLRPAPSSSSANSTQPECHRRVTTICASCGPLGGYAKANKPIRLEMIFNSCRQVDLI